MFRCDIGVFGLFAAAAAMLAGASPALAQGTGQPAQPPASSDVTRADFIATMDAEFRKRDADGDGLVTYAELQQFERNQILAAAVRENARIFGQLDQDHDGMLSPGEFQALVAVPPASDVNGQMERFDQNRDRTITIVEYRAATLVNFDRLDTDLDGVVTDAEMKAGNIQPAAGPSGR